MGKSNLGHPEAKQMGCLECIIHDVISCGCPECAVLLLLLRAVCALVRETGPIVGKLRALLGMHP